MENKIQTMDLRSDFDKLFDIVKDQQDLIMKLFHETSIDSRKGANEILDLSSRINMKIGILIVNSPFTIQQLLDE